MYIYANALETGLLIRGVREAVVSDRNRKPAVPGEVRRYLLGYVPSVPFLEAALLLRAEPQTDWDAAKLARRLYARQREAELLLAGLHTAQLAVPSGNEAFRYTADPERRRLMDAVTQAYATNLLEVTELIHSKIDKRARVFADAFKLRKD
jgi:hypothetical protein